MIKDVDSIEFIEEYFVFHHDKHSILTKYLLKKLAEKFLFKLDIKKASIHLKSTESFAVMGYRRSIKSIFIEFYSSVNVEDEIIVKANKAKNGFIINKVNIENIEDINEILIDYIYSSSLII